MVEQLSVLLGIPFQEGKAFDVGTKRTWKDGVYEKQKTANGDKWVRISKKDDSPSKQKSLGEPATTKSIDKSEPSAIRPVGTPKKERRVITPHVPRSEIAAGIGPTSITPEAQKGIRMRAQDAIENSGITSRIPNARKRHTIKLKNIKGLGGHVNPKTGYMVINTSYAQDIKSYYGSGLTPNEIGQRFVDGDEDTYYQVMSNHTILHEQLHTCGPDIHYEGRGVFAEEMATEMAARAITAKIHSIRSYDLESGPYAKNLRPAINAISTASNSTYEEAYEALAQSALEFKKHVTPDILNGEAVLQHLGAKALERLGTKTSEAKSIVHQAFVEIADSM